MTSCGGSWYSVERTGWQLIDEGQRDHGYRAERMTIVGTDGAEHDASVYVAHAKMIDDSLRPDAAYRDPDRRHRAPRQRASNGVRRRASPEHRWRTS